MLHVPWPNIGRTRWLKRVSLASIIVLLVGGIFIFHPHLGPFQAKVARADCCTYETQNAVPASAVDNYGNRFVFWWGVGNQNLYEAFYRASTSTWSGPIGLGMGPLGSEPTVAVTQAGTNGKEYGYQYVFWEGTSPSLSLWEAYWDGSWHGPINLGMGPLGSAPSAVSDGSDGVITVVWTGQDNQIWYTYTFNGNSPSHQTWSGPRLTGWGPVGTKPTAADAYESGAVQVFWDGNDNYLWRGQLAAGGSPFPGGPHQLSVKPWSELGVAGFVDALIGFPGTPVYDITWAGADGDLWEMTWADDGTGTGKIIMNPVDLGMGPLGSAPTVSFQEDNQVGSNEFYFWAGATPPHNLWEASVISGGPITGPIELGMGPLMYP